MFIIEVIAYFFPITGKEIKKKGMVLPFEPLSMAFSNINYFVDVPVVYPFSSTYNYYVSF